MRNASRQIIAGILIYFVTIFQVFGQAALLPNAEQQYFNNNGQPLASGSVSYFVPGTTTPKTTWQNATQTINNQNPVPLDIGGKAITYGQGSYRQQVKDASGNVIWDQTTTAYGASQPSGATGTDTAPVGTVLPFSGFVVPTNWALAYGQALSRTTYATLMAAITISAPSISCTSGSPNLTGFTDTSTIRIGAPIEATCLPTSTTVSSITNATTIVVSQNAAATATVTATIFPWGNGDQVTTFNVPDLRGRAPVGADCMGYVASGNTCAGNLTATYYGANPGAFGQVGGTQSKNLTIANINPFTPTGTISTITPAGTITNGAITISPNNLISSAGGGLIPGGGSEGQNSTVTASQATSTFTGTPVTPTFTGASLGSGTALSVVNPDATFNYIIKVTPNSSGAGGVVSFGGMFGDIVCASSLTCAPIGTVNTVGCTPATTSQIGCVQPDGVTTLIQAGKLVAVAGVASSVGIGSTAITSGTSGDILYDNAGALGQLTTSGTGSVAMTNSPTFVTPTLGVATATSLNGNVFTGGPYTLSGVSGKTLTFDNTMTLAGVDSSTLTFQGTDTYVGRSTTDTLTNKTISGANNTLTVRLGSDVTGNLPVLNLNGGSGASSSTFWRGDGTWAAPAGSGNVTGPGSSTSGDLVTYNGTSGTSIQDQPSISTSQAVTLGGTTTLNGKNYANGDTYFGSGRPWFDVLSTAQGCAAADPTGVTDSTSAIQCHINYMHTTYGGGVVYVSPGTYLVSGGGLNVTAGVWLIGAGLDASTIDVTTDSIAVLFSTSGGTCPSGGHYGGMEKLSVLGYQNASTTQSAVSIGASCNVTIRDSRLWFGKYGLSNAGVDSVIDNDFICGYTGCVVSSGANWYIRDKLDAISPGTIPTTYALRQINSGSSSVVENHFMQMDLSCGCTVSVSIEDGKAITHFDGSVFDSPISISTASGVQIMGSEIGSTSITAGAGVLIMSGDIAFGATTVTGAATRSCSANYQITC